MNLERLDKFRVTRDPMFGTKLGDRWGCFFIPIRSHRSPLKVICSPFDGSQEWEHVSVSLPDRCPTWGEMCIVKDLFWSDEKCVVQYHPPKDSYVNNCKNCLHLWRNIAVEFPQPSTCLVGIKGLEL